MRPGGQLPKGYCTLPEGEDGAERETAWAPTSLELFQLSPENLEASLQLLRLKGHLVHILLQRSVLLLLLHLLAFLTGVLADQGFLHLQGQGLELSPL